MAIHGVPYFTMFYQHMGLKLFISAVNLFLQVEAQHNTIMYSIIIKKTKFVFWSDDGRTDLFTNF